MKRRRNISVAKSLQRYVRHPISNFLSQNELSGLADFALSPVISLSLQDVCLALFSHSSYTLEVLSRAGVLRIAHYFPTIAFGHALAKKAVKECTTLTKKLMVLRGGIFASVWRALTHDHDAGPSQYPLVGSTEAMKHVFAWCYPQGNVSDCLITME